MRKADKPVKIKKKMTGGTETDVIFIFMLKEPYIYDKMPLLIYIKI